MTTATITVTAIQTRSVSTKWGVKPVYELVAQDGTVFNYGFKTPAAAGISVGSSVSFEYTTDKYGNKIDFSTARPASAGSGTTAATVPSASAPALRAGNAGTSWKGGGVFPIPRTSGELAIIRQNALTNAAKSVHDWFALKATTLDEDDAADLLPETLNEYAEIILNTAYKFAEFSSGQREVKAAEGIARRAAADPINAAIRDSVGSVENG